MKFVTICDILASFQYTIYTYFYYFSLSILQVSSSPGFKSSPCHLFLVMIKATHDNYLYNYYMVCALLSHTYHVTHHVM